MIHEDTLLPDVRKCEEIIRNARKDSPDTPSDEWLADNYHIVSDAIESLKQLEFKRRAVIAVYNIATEILSRNDGLVREEDVLKVVSFHQNTHPLGSESLVYLCPMLQLAVLKRIADICETTEKSKEPRMLISLGVSMGNAIKSLRSLPTFDWENMLSELNVIEQILRGDPADIYTKMTLIASCLVVPEKDFLLRSPCSSMYHTTPPQRPSVLLNTFPFVSSFFLIISHPLFCI